MEQQRWSSTDADLDSVAQQVECKTLLQRLTSFPRRRPFLFQFYLNSAVNFGADFNTQVTAEGRRPFSEDANRKLDWHRLCTFMCFGAVQACTAWAVYVRMFKALFPGAIRFSNKSWAEKLKDRQGQIDVLKQTAGDLFFYTPFIFFPNFYLFKTMIQGGAWDDLSSLLKATWDRYKQTVVTDNVVTGCIYLPLDIVVFAVPAWMRLPTTIGLNYFFIMLLSFFRGAERPHIDSIRPLEGPV